MKEATYETSLKVCPECSETFEATTGTMEIFGRTFTMGDKLCPKCQEAWEKNIAKAGQPEKKTKWEDICPPCYQGFDLQFLPSDESRKVAAKAFAWNRGSKGIGLIGHSRTGKTFILHELMRRWFEHGVDIEMTTSTKFAYNMGSPSRGERINTIDRCIRAEFLYVDDVGKEKMTDRVEADFFHVIEERRRAKMPMFTSVNSDGATLAAKMSQDSGIPIINRLKYDLCQFIAIETK